MEVKLKNISMRNFRKYVDETFAFDGNSVIEAANGLGKSTILNAFLWALTGKDVDGKSDPSDFRTVGAPPEVAPSVSVTLSIDGIDSTFTRKIEPTYSGRGLDKAYKGDQTVCFIDGVPKAVGEYKAYLDGIFPIGAALWLDVYCFSDDTKFAVEDRRKLLVDSFGNVTDEDVFASNASFAELATAKGNLSVDDFKLKCKETEKACTAALGRGKTIGTLQARIDEAYKAIVADIDKDAEEAEIGRIENEIAALSITQNDELSKKRTEAENKMRELQRAEESRRQAEYSAAIKEWEAKSVELNKEHDSLAAERAKTDREYGYSLLDFDNLSNDLLAAENDLMAILSDEYVPNDICPTCGQKIPKKMREEAAENYFEQRAIKQEQAENRIAEIKAKLSEKESAAETARRKLDELDADIDLSQKKREAHLSIRPEMPPLGKKFLKQQAVYQGILESLVPAPIDHERIAALTADLKIHQAALAKAQMNEKQKARINELKEEQVRTNAALLDAQRLIALCEDFSITKAHFIEDEIAKHFNGVRFELFSFYKNGEVKNTCRPIVDGKPYRILSFSQKILASAAIIDGLGKHFGFKAPLFIDNCSELDANSMHELESLDRQVVFIKVSENPLTTYSL